MKDALPRLDQTSGSDMGLAAFPRREEMPTARVGLSSRLAGAIRQLPMLPVLVVAFIVFSITVDGFNSTANFQNIARQLSVILVAVSGETLVLLIGGIDLSVGATIGLSSVCGAYTMRATGSPMLGLLACLGTGLVVGTLNGLGISRAKLQPFIMTFGMMLTARAVALLLTGGRSMGRLPASLLASGRMTVLGVPLIFIIGLAIASVIAVILHKTIFGQNVYLMGSNKRAARFSGIDVRRLEFQVYVIAGTLAGGAGFLFMMRLGAATPTAGDPLLLQIIGAAVLGGTSLSGGEGSILRSITGCLLVAMLNNSLEILGAQFWDQMIVIGTLIALGSALGSWLSRRRATESRTERLAAARPAGATTPAAKG